MEIDEKKGGLLQGKSHKQGGIKTINVDTGDLLEVEGGEIIINKAAAQLHCEELSAINQSAGGGVEIPCDTKGGNSPVMESGGKIDNEILSEYILHEDLDASIKIEKINPMSDKVDYDLGYRFKAKISYPESLGEQGNYDEGYVYKTYPTEEEQKTDIRELLESERKNIIEGGKKAWGLEEIYSGRDEDILKAIKKVLDKKEIEKPSTVKKTTKYYRIKDTKTNEKN